MIEAIGKYSDLIKGLIVTISTKKTVEIRFTGFTNRLKDGVRYHITAEYENDYVKDKGLYFRTRILSASPMMMNESILDFARYKGIIRINEGAGGMKEKQGGELKFYRGDAFSSKFKNVALDKTSGWVTVAIPKTASAYSYRTGDLLYVDGTLYHRIRDVDGTQFYELNIRAEQCHKVDGTEYWERVRAAQHHATRFSKEQP